MSPWARMVRSLRCRFLGHMWTPWRVVLRDLLSRNPLALTCARCRPGSSFDSRLTLLSYLYLEETVPESSRLFDEIVRQYAPNPYRAVLSAPRAGTAATAPPARMDTPRTASAPPPDPLYVTETGAVVSWSSPTAEGRHESALWTPASVTARG